MSKNIEEIVESVLPIAETDNYIPAVYAERTACQRKLNQALTEKKLVVPMSLEAIHRICIDYSYEYADEMADRLYQAQFGGNK